jgi:hypothetical protein
MEGKVRVVAIMTGVQNGDNRGLQMREPYKEYLSRLQEKKLNPRTPNIARISGCTPVVDRGSGLDIPWF